MPAIQYEHHNFGKPYKVFKDLTTEDPIYFIDFKNLKVIPIQIYDVSVEDKSDYFSENRFFVYIKTFDINLSDETIKVYDGNTFICQIWDGTDKLFFSTDERIANEILSILRARNNYQWDTFTGLFGNPMSGYAHKEVRLC